MSYYKCSSTGVTKMGIKIRGSCFGCLLLALILQGAVCQDDRCRTFVSKTVTIGQDRTIHCNVSCGDPRHIEWGQQGSDDRVSQGPNYIIRDIRNISIGGMVYWCQCPGDDQNRQCFNILVNPHIFKFITEPSEVTVGSAFTLICKAEGYPAPQPQHYHLGRVVHVPNVHVPQMYHPVPLGVEVTIANVTVEYTGNYSCVVNVGSELHTTSNTARVTVYEPPKLRGIRNFTMSNGGSNQSAILECMIERTPSAEVVMEWRRNDILLSSSWKYVNWTVNLDSGSNLLVAILVVRDVSDGDLGAYECRLYSNYSYLRSRSEDVMEAWIMAPDAPNTPTTEGVGECDCGSHCTGTVVAAVIEAVMLVFIFVAVIAIIAGVTLWRKHKEGVCSASAQDENGVAPTQCTNRYVAPILPQVTQDGQEMDSVDHHVNPYVAVPLTSESDLQDTNHALHVSSDEDRGPPPAGPHPEHEVETNVPNQSANSYVTAPVEVAQNEQGMDRVVQRGNSNVNTPIVEPAQSANVPPTGEVNAHPEQADQERTADEDHTLSANTGETTTNNQLGDQVGDGSPQPQTYDGVRPTLDEEKHIVQALKARSVRRHQSLPDNTLSMSWPRSGGRFLFDEEQQGKPRRGSRSSDDDPGVHRRSKPPPSPLAHTSLKSSRSTIKKRRTSTASISSKKQSQAEDDAGQVLLESPKTPKSSSHTSRRQSKSENDEETHLLEQSSVDEEHPTIDDEHTSDDS